MSYQDYMFDGWLRDQQQLAQTWFTCSVCEQDLSVRERDRSGYDHQCCKKCVEKIETEEFGKIED